MVNRKDKKNKNANINEENNNDDEENFYENKNNYRNSKSLNKKNNERPNSSPTIQDTSLERIVSTKQNIKKLRKEESLALKHQKVRKPSWIKKKRSSMSLLSYLISEETIRAAKISEDERKQPSGFENFSRKGSPSQRDPLVTINEPDEVSVITTSSGNNYKYDNMPSTTKKNPSKVSVADSGKILSYLLNTQSLPKMAAIADDETTGNELLVGYRDRKTNEMKLTIVPADCFVIYQEDEPKSTFTIVIKEDADDKSEFGFTDRGVILDNEQVDEVKTTKSALRDSNKGRKDKPFDTKPFTGYINPSWPKKQ